MSKQSPQTDPFARALRNLRLFWSPIEELIHGFRSQIIPWHYCAGWMLFSTALLVFKIDHYLLSNTGLNALYPYYQPLYRLYAFSISSLGFWIWAWLQVKKKREKLATLTAAFKNAGLESKIGRLPNLISDFPIDSTNRKLRLTNAGFPLSKFNEQKKYLESELGIYIDVIKEDRERRAVDVVYSHIPMAESVVYNSEQKTPSFGFLVGRTRAHQLIGTLKETPHLLIAGQTGGGKSTFLRQMIVHLHLRQKATKFLLIDLKGGLEFSIFENRKQFRVVPNVIAAIEELKLVNHVLDERMTLLKAHQCKDIDAYMAKKDLPGRTLLNRHVVVVDEAAEMFLAGNHANSKEIQAARGILSRVARLGRAVGVHIVVATQRPDTRALDSQVKANLTGVICFQMMNDASSISVLGNGRASDLPRVPGRAIWKNGMDMLEVQTPFLDADAAEALLGPADDIKKDETIKVSDDQSTSESTTTPNKEDYRTPKE